MSDADRLVPFYEGRAKSLERDAEEVRGARERVDYLLRGMALWAADLRSLAARHDEQLTRAEKAEAELAAANKRIEELERGWNRNEECAICHACICPACSVPGDDLYPERCPSCAGEDDDDCDGQETRDRINAEICRTCPDPSACDDCKLDDIGRDEQPGWKDPFGGEEP